jgi:uncharacterized membrane protein
MNTQKRTTTQIRRSILATSFVFLAVSYFGWVYETLLCAISHGYFCDRGFLRLPFCPIYGGAVVALGLLLGTPIEGRYASAVDRLCRRFGWRDGVGCALRYAGYYLLAMLLATAVELVVGLLFQRLGYDLWSYASAPYNFRGVICPSVSICWGFLLTVVMRYPYTWMMRLARSAPTKTLAIPTVLLLAALLVDFILLLWL